VPGPRRRRYRLSHPRPGGRSPPGRDERLRNDGTTSLGGAIFGLSATPPPGRGRDHRDRIDGGGGEFCRDGSHRVSRVGRVETQIDADHPK